MNILLLFGIILFSTVAISFLFKRYNLPQVIGHILVGVILGQSALDVVTTTMVVDLTMVTYFALGLIGFTIGGELRWARIKRFGASILIITFFETVISSIVVFGAIYLLTKNLPLALISVVWLVTAPGGTTNVIQEYKARGQLTSTLYGVVGADDAFAIILFSILSGIAKVMVGVVDTINVMGIFSHMISDIGGAFVLGISLVYFFIFNIKHKKS